MIAVIFEVWPEEGRRESPMTPERVKKALG